MAIILLTVALLSVLGLVSGSDPAGPTTMVQSHHHTTMVQSHHPTEHHETKEEREARHAMEKAKMKSDYHRQDYANEAVEVTSDSLSDDDDDQEVERDCSFFDHWELRKALSKVVCGKSEADCGTGAFPGGSQPGKNPNGGFGLNVWATIVNRAGRVCAVVKSGRHFDDQWTHSRIISAQKAATANGFSLDEFALSTANLNLVTASGQQLQGLTDTNAINPVAAYAGSIAHWGESCTSDDDEDHDALCGVRLGGVVTFGGGLGLYDKDGNKVGGLGVSGESSCADHIISWKLRHLLKLDYVRAGPNGNSDQISYTTGNFKHAPCGLNEQAVALPDVRRP